jgi:hypothetical protein
MLTSGHDDEGRPNSHGSEAVKWRAHIWRSSRFADDQLLKIEQPVLSWTSKRFFLF